MNSEEKLDRLYSDMIEIKVSLARVEELLHRAPCSELRGHMQQQRGDIAELHQQYKQHIEGAHSAQSLRENWAALVALLSALCSLCSLIFLRDGGLG